MSRYLMKTVMAGLAAVALACGGGGGGSDTPPIDGWTNLIAPTVADMSADVTSTSNWNHWANGDGVAPVVTAGEGDWAGTMEVTSEDYGPAGTTHDGVDATDFGFYVQAVAGDGASGNATYHLQVGKTYQVKIKAASTVADQWVELVVQTGSDPYTHWVTYPFQPDATLTEYASPEFTVSEDVAAAWFVINMGGNGTSGAVFHFDDAALNEK